MTEATLRLQARTAQASPGGRRGVVRLSSATMAALGLSQWDPVRLTVAPPGTGATAGVAASAPTGTHPFLLLMDAATMANLGISDGTDVDVGPAATARAHAERVLLATATATDAATGDLSAYPVEVVRLAMLGMVVSRGDAVSLSLDAPQPLRARVLDVVPADSATVTMATVVAYRDGAQTTTSATTGTSTPAAGAMTAPGLPPAAGHSATAPAVAQSRPMPPPGLEQPYAALTEWLDLDFHRQELLARLGSGGRLGVLVSGPAGSGKVSLVRAAAAAVGARVVALWAPALVGLSADAAVARLRSAGEQASSLTPTVLLIEDIDALVGTARPTGAEGMLLAELATRIADRRIAVVATTSRPDACDPRLRERGLLERQVELALYTRPQRRQALLVLTAPMPLAPDVDLDAVAARSPGFVLADLGSLVHEAGVRAASRQRSSAGGASPPPLTVSMADFEGALEVVRPTGAEGGSLEVPDLDLDDVGDMAPVKAALTETVLWPLTHPDSFARLGVDPPRGVLLYGPPGCGKTFLVRALAGTGQVTVLPVKGAEVLSKWVGESERGLREVFRRARQSAPALVFLDEIDALAPQRGQSSDSGVTDRVVAALLTELDGIDAMAGVSVIGATNRPDLIDAAVLRPGRLERLVFVPPPDAAARTLILASAARHSPLSPDIDLDEVGRHTEGFSAADCAALVREAALTSMRRSMESGEITLADVEAALSVVRPSLDPFQVVALEAFAHSRAG